MSDEPKITTVYTFVNGMTATFDQYGKQMPDFQGLTSECVPKIRASGFTGDIPYGEYRPRAEGP